MTQNKPSASFIKRRVRAADKPTSAANAYASQFIRLIKFVFEKVDQLEEQQRSSLLILLTMAICTEEDTAGIQATGSFHSTPFGTVLRWTRKDGTADARAVSAVVSACTDLNDVAVLVDMRANVEAALRKLKAKGFYFEGNFAELLNCVAAWCFFNLPAIFYSHVVGFHRMTPLPLSAFRRLETHRPLQISTAEIDGKGEAAKMSALVGYLRSEGDDEDKTLIGEIVQACRLRDEKGRADSDLLLELGESLREFVVRANRAGPLTSLTLAVALTLVYQADLRPRTIVRYLRSGIPVIHEAFSGACIERLNTNEASERLSKALAHLCSGFSVNDASAFIAHYFSIGRRYTELPKLDRRQFPNVAVASVAANRVFPHEIALILNWIGEDFGDPRLREQAHLIVSLLYELPFRPAEVLLLQVRNVRVAKTGVIEIEVSEYGRGIELKSPAARRVLKASNRLEGLLKSWLSRRSGDSANENDLLFGTKNAPQRHYRLDELYSWIASALKCATGDRKVTVYSLRHSAIDREFSSMTPEDIRGGALEQLSIDAGHSSLQVTAHSYLHTFEFHLRAFLEREIEGTISLCARAVGHLLDISESAVRKAASRSKAKTNSI